MRIIFSRKGFDSTSGGKPSPILPDGRIVSFPIPDKQSSIRYNDIRWQEYNLGSFVSDLTGGRIPGSYFAHLDPDLSKDSLSRSPDWKPLLGQTGAAQGHLRKNGVRAVDIFLFFGLYQNVILSSGKLEWDTRSPRRHLLWGWLQIDEAVKVDGCNLSKFEWARYHPHFQREPDANNTIYVARKYLALPGVSSKGLFGSGVFSHISEGLVLTDPDGTTPSEWKLPRWFYPCEGKFPLTYHSDLARWQKTDNAVRLRAVARGQEFILNTEEFPEAVEWLKELIECR